MGTKFSVFIVISFILLILNAKVSADWENDALGDHYVTGYDLKRAKVEVYPQTEESPPAFIKISLEMDDLTSTLPGIVIFEFDVDHSETTGGSSSMLGIPLSPCSCKTCAGFDVTILLMLRDQSDTSALAWCNNCVGPAAGPCYLRGAECTNCGGDTCYQQGDSCGIGDPDCYQLGDGCICNEPDCYTLDQPCEETCDMGREIGEWYTTFTGGDIIDRGRIEMPPPKETGSGSYDTYLLPWERMLEKAKSAGADFNLNYAISNPPKYQVSVWHDEDFADGDDFFDSPFSLNVSDWLPNGDGNKAVAQWGCGYDDADRDDIPDDGDLSGTPVDNPCTGGATEDCDDNCPTIHNPDQADEDENGIGDLCLGDSVQEDWETDALGDYYVTGYDLKRAKVEVYPQTEESPPAFINISLEMDDLTSTLPGIVAFEFDVDHSETTGGSVSLLGIPLSPCPCKTCAGMDMLVLLMLRDQSDTSALAWCNDCIGPGSPPCYERGAECTECDTPPCYERGNVCSDPSNPDCYLVGDTCICNELDCYRLDQPCEEACDMGRELGEWYIALPTGLVTTIVDRGRIEMPPPKETGSGSYDTYLLPWERMLQKAKSAGADFNLDYAISNPPKYQVSVWHDEDFADGDDFFDEPFTLNVSDWLPNGDGNKATAKMCNGPSVSVSDADRDGILDDEDNSPYIYNPDQEDADEDGVGDVSDSCLETPNGPSLGTCVKDVGGVTMSYIVGDSFITCDSNADCEATEGTCQKTQSDWNGNGIGDVCEGYADFNCDGVIGAEDLSALQQSQCVGKTISYQNGCQEFDKYDINDDDRVSTWDYIIWKLHYGAHDLLLPSYCP